MGTVHADDETNLWSLCGQCAWAGDWLFYRVQRVIVSLWINRVIFPVTELPARPAAHLHHKRVNPVSSRVGSLLSGVGHTHALRSSAFQTLSFLGADYQLGLTIVWPNLLTSDDALDAWTAAHHDDIWHRYFCFLGLILALRYRPKELCVGISHQVFFVYAE